MTAALIACGHGTRSEAGRATIDALRDRIAVRAAEIPVVEAYVDVHGPDIGAVAAEPRRHGAVIVPLLLSTGFHTAVDIARAAAATPSPVAVAGALGPHPLLADVLVDRVVVAGAGVRWPLVIAAAGSSDERAADDVAAMRELVAARWRGPVTVGYAAAMTPSVAEAVAAAAAGGSPVAVATYLLAPGYFADLVARAGGTVTSAPLGADDRVAAVAVQRYAEALASSAAGASGASGPVASGAAAG